MLTFALVEKQGGKKPTGKDILVLVQLTWHYQHRGGWNKNKKGK